MHILLVLTVLALCVAHCRSDCNVQKRGVDASAQSAIIRKHNQLRAKVATGNEGNLPRASNMQAVIWDDAVARRAQEWANKCKFEHDTAGDRDTGRGYTGQNIAKSWNQDPNPDWEGIIQSFYNEVSKFNQNTIDSYQFDKDTGHFTQVIWANTNRIGCGYVRTQENGFYVHLYGCNYLPGGNIIGQSIYKRGDACTSCGGCGPTPGLCRNVAG